MPRRRRLTLPPLPKALSDRLFSPSFFSPSFFATTPRLSPSATGPKTNFQIMSDLHLEFSPTPTNNNNNAPESSIDQYLQFKIPPKAPYLILAGDIGLLVPHYDRYLTFLRHQTEAFEHVFLVLGNHEFYRASRAQGLLAAEKMQTELHGRLTVLNRKRVDLLCGVTVLGATLHSMILKDSRAQIERCVSDFRAIEGWSVDDHNKEHELDREWLEKELAAIDAEEATGVGKRVVVVTHHAPSFSGTSAPEHEGSALASAFCTDLLRTAEKRWRGAEMVRLWVFGHTHFSTDFLTNRGMRVVANQKGYFNDMALAGKFNVEMVVSA